MKFDSLPLQILETGAGFLKASVVFAVPGVLPYYIDGKLFHQAKLPEDVLSPETIKSADGAPITDEHPRTPEGAAIPVTPDNYKIFSKGALSGAHVEDGKGKGVVTIYDPILIDKIKSGKVGVSMGFNEEQDSTPGIYNGVRYDSSQKNIRINHLAIVDIPRAGIEATKINLYGDSMIANTNGAGNASQTGKVWSYKTLEGNKELTVDSKDVMDELMELRRKNQEMESKIKADGAEIDDLHQKIQATNPSVPSPEGQAAKEDLIKQIEQHKTNEEALMTQIKAFQEQFDALAASIPDQVDKAATDKMDAKSNVNAVDPSAKTDGLSTIELKKLFIEKVSGGNIKTDAMDKMHVDAHYEACKQTAKIMATTYNRTGVQVDSAQLQVDSQKIMEKRERLTNYYDETHKGK